MARASQLRGWRGREALREIRQRRLERELRDMSRRIRAIEIRVGQQTQAERVLAPIASWPPKIGQFPATPPELIERLKAAAAAAAEPAEPKKAKPRIKSGATRSRAKARVEAAGTGPACESPAVERVSRPAAGRSAAATSERMDVTAGETAPVCPHPPVTDRRLSDAGPKDAAGRQSVDTLRAERERPGADVTAGETATDIPEPSPPVQAPPVPVAKRPAAPAVTLPAAPPVEPRRALPKGERLALPTSSAMDRLFTPLEQANLASRESTLAADDKIFCGPCDHRVPRWFGRDCITVDCPLKVRA